MLRINRINHQKLRPETLDSKIKVHDQKGNIISTKLLTANPEDKENRQLRRFFESGGK